MGNIRIHVEGYLPAVAPAETWIAALVVSLPHALRSEVIKNLESIKRQNPLIKMATPGGAHTAHHADIKMPD